MQEFHNFLNNTVVYHYNMIDNVLGRVRKYFRFDRINTKHKYYNVPCSFDIETTSFYNPAGEKQVITYCWTFGIYGLVIFGRTWEQFHELLETLIDRLNLSTDKRLIVYIHNLSHEFQFIMKQFSFEKVFAIDRRKPLYALTTEGIEFRCSYLLSGYSLEKLGDQLHKYHVQKLVSDLDYSLIRHTSTPMTLKERGYCENDVRVVMAYIAECIDDEGGISRIPYTKTGYVRRYVKDCCFYEKGKPRKKSVKRLHYRDNIKSLTLTPEVYQLLKEAFQGGFTHSNACIVGRTLENVSSYDFTSSYPTVMIAEQFPMSQPFEVDVTELTQEQFYDLLKCYCCLFSITYYDITEKPEVYENYISRSRCNDIQNAIVNNGRVVKADTLTITITEQDFEIIKHFYNYSNFEVNVMYKFYKNYLPKDFIIAILQLYEDKTTLKGVQGKEVEYLVSKGMLNSCYGMAVTDIIREVNEFSDYWEEPYLPDTEEAIEKYNKAPNRFLYYPWGVWVTAYARRNLFTGILEAGADYCYSDTDSIKLVNAEKHKSYFETYNRTIIEQLETTMQYYDLPVERIRPKTIKGIEKPLGVWDFEGTYDRFKTLGAKRYLTEKDGEAELTVAGLGKKSALKYMQKQDKDIFEQFEDNLYIPKGDTGKLTHTYIDDEMHGLLTDYTGVTAEFHELSGVHLEECDYTMGLGNEFINFLLDLWSGNNEYS